MCLGIEHSLYHLTSTDHHDSMKDLNILVGDEWTGDLREAAIEMALASDRLYELALKEGLSYYAARDFAPRAKETKLCVSASIKDLIAFVNQRASEQCQPTSDSILAMWVRKCILETYPTYSKILEEQMPVDPVEHIYLNAITHKFNLNTFPPLPHHKKILDERNVDLTGIKFGHDKCKTEYHAYDEYKALKTSLGNTKKKKVYIASGWFNPEQLNALEHVEHFMKTQDKYDFFAPRLDNKGEEGSDWDNVIQRNYDELETCDYMIASTVGKDMGTLVEVGAFIEKGKPVIFYAPGLEGPFNLMLAKAASRVCTTPAEFPVKQLKILMYQLNMKEVLNNEEHL